MTKYRRLTDGCYAQPDSTDFRSDSWLVLDTECTGLNLSLDRTIELGMVWGRETQIEGEWCARFQPPRSVGDSREIHGISDEDLAHEPPYAHWAAHVQDLLTVPGRALWAYNVWYDRSMLMREHDLTGHPLPVFGWKELTHLLPLLGLSTTDASGKRYRPSLTRACSRLGIKRGRAHNALDDARDAAKILMMAYSLPGAS